MKIPKNMTEDQVTQVIIKVASKMGKYKFGPYEVEDIIQQAIVFGIEAMDRYDGVRPLENFLARHIKNRLINFKRDKFKRVECPCKLCSVYPTKHKDGKYCKKYLVWEDRNKTKQGLCGTAEVFDNRGFEEDWDANIDLQEKINKIESQMPQEYRSTYLKMKANVFVTKERRNKVEQIIRSILNETSNC